MAFLKTGEKNTWEAAACEHLRDGERSDLFEHPWRTAGEKTTNGSLLIGS